MHRTRIRSIGRRVPTPTKTAENATDTAGPPRPQYPRPIQPLASSLHVIVVVAVAKFFVLASPVIKTIDVGFIYATTIAATAAATAAAAALTEAAPAPPEFWRNLASEVDAHIAEQERDKDQHARHLHNIQHRTNGTPVHVQRH